MNRIWLTVCVMGMAGLMAFAGVAHAQAQIGYVDMKRLLDEAPQVSEGRSKLAREFESRNDELKVMERRLDSMEQRLVDESASLSEEQRINLEWEIRSLRREINTTRQQLSDDLNIRLNEELAQVDDQVEQAIRSIAREQGYDLVLSSPVEFASDRINLTDQVLQRLRERFQRGQSGDQ